MCLQGGCDPATENPAPCNQLCQAPLQPACGELQSKALQVALKARLGDAHESTVALSAQGTTTPLCPGYLLVP